VSGYYYPTPRLDAAALSGPAIPVLGDILRYTLAPLLGRALWPGLMRKIFGPASMPESFADGFPRGLALRPSQLRASAAESALMVPAAVAGRARYTTLGMPVVILAGAGDRLVDAGEQSERLHRQIRHSAFHRVARAGHMVHQTAPLEVLRAIDQAAAGSSGKRPEFTAAE
jgi:pimeloyl-ACP methyl ester carboxylesterase